MRPLPGGTRHLTEVHRGVARSEQDWYCYVGVGTHVKWVGGKVCIGWEGGGGEGAGTFILKLG